MILFAVRHPRLVCAAAGLAILGLFVGAGALPHLAERGDSAGSGGQLWLVLLFVPLLLAGAVMLAWFDLAGRLRDSRPRDFLLGTYRGQPVYATTNSLFTMAPVSLIPVGGAAVFALNAHGLSDVVVWTPMIFAPLFAALWLFGLFQPSCLRLTPDGVVCRRGLFRGQTIPWDALNPGVWQTHHDRDGGIWLLVDGSVPERTTASKPGRPDGPPGYHWIRVSTVTLIDPAFLDRAISYYRHVPDARSLIGTADGRRALRTAA